MEETRYQGFSQNKTFGNVTIKPSEINTGWVSDQTVYPSPDVIPNQEFWKRHDEV